MLVLDASAILWAWDNYPEKQFPGVWHWLSQQILNNDVTIPSVALAEVNHKDKKCPASIERSSTTELATG